ncbi:hypothetical protein QF032_001369 [Streptomyces achromogenes]|uniref:hypothetical protein n=1 Tax=Streptomyces achromogenes TaxID=67255 RepID=UPI00277EB9CA|nr:hypothetical protein [Streptomyces achromogenes]MDQ0829525.1 hypothetical protein [Streptomyces achromogenes]
MARLQILELPTAYPDTATMDSNPARPPFALILDGLDEQDADALLSRSEALEAFAEQCGASAVGVFPFPVDLA